MTNHHGDFIWYELMTPDADAAARFYASILGWQDRPAQAAAAGTYRIFSAAGTDVGGLYCTAGDPRCAGLRPAWIGYVGVDDVDASAADVQAAGGTILMPPTDIPGVGRFAMIADPQGVPCYVMRGAVDAVSTAFAPDTPGHCQWNELATADQQAALAFYGGRFGWQPGDAVDMGELGDYRFLVQRSTTIGAVMNAPPGGPPPTWTFYFGVPDIDRAATAIVSGGGTVHHGPAEVPGGSRIVVASDPQGASFGLVAPPATG